MGYPIEYRSDVNRPATSTSQKKPDTIYTTLPWVKEGTSTRAGGLFPLEIVQELMFDHSSDDDDCYDPFVEDVSRLFTRHELTEAWKMGEDPLNDLLYREREKIRKYGPKYATAGVSYMREKGHNLELVKPGLFESSETEDVELIHFNFQARNADDPNAPVETYFGQLNDYWNGDPALIVDCCFHVANPAPPMDQRDTQRCEICRRRLVHHPIGAADCKGIDLGHARWVTACYD